MQDILCPCVQSPVSLCPELVSQDTQLGGHPAGIPSSFLKMVLKTSKDEEMLIMRQILGTEGTILSFTTVKGAAAIDEMLINLIAGVTEGISQGLCACAHMCTSHCDPGSLVTCLE